MMVFLKQGLSSKVSFARHCRHEVRRHLRDRSQNASREFHGISGSLVVVNPIIDHPKSSPSEGGYHPKLSLAGFIQASPGEAQFTAVPLVDVKSSVQSREGKVCGEAQF